MNLNIVVVEDNQDIREYTQELLTDNGYHVHQAPTGLKGKKLVEKIQPDLILLDLKLPDITGETLCKEFKEMYPEIVVIMLTAKDTPEDLAKGLELGADDYIAKPFTPQELLARIQARMRTKGSQSKLLEIADLSLNPNTHEVTRAQSAIELSPQEFKLLEYFMNNPNQVLSREMILTRIWGTAADVETRVIDVYIGYLRKKIDKDHPVKLIQSVRGFGYMLTEK